MDDQTQAEPIERRTSKKKGRHGLGHIYEHRASWWLDVRIRGKRHRQKLGLVRLLEKREARQIADERINSLLMPKPPEPLPEKGTMPFAQFAKKFVAWASGTKRSWGRYHDKLPEQTPLAYALKYFGEVSLKDITANRVEDFRLHLLNVRKGNRRLKRASANRYVSLLRHAFYWAIQNGDADKNPVAALNKKMLDEEHPPTRVLEEGDEQRKLIEAMPSWLRLMTIFCLQTAARRGELVNLTWESIHPENVELCETKDSEKRSIRLSPDAKAILVLLRPREIKAREFVFEPTIPRKTLVARIRREWERAVSKSGVAKIRFHDLRHTALTRLVLTGTDLRTVKDIAGHSSLKTTQRYLHSSDKLQQQAVEKLSGEFGRYISTTDSASFEQSPANATIQ
jgi:integrase